MPVFVADFSFSRPDPAALRRVGYAGVARYLSHDPSKNLTDRERDAVFAAGMSILLVWESTADRALAGFLAGLDDGREASKQADALGFPKTRPLFTAVDFDVTAPHMGRVLTYLHGFAQAVLPRPAGVYGSAALIDAAVPSAALFGWQTAAWSHGRVSSGAALYQRVSAVLPHVAGSYDENVVLVADYGQWGGAPDPPIIPVPGPHQPPIEYDEETDEMIHRELFDCGVLDPGGNAQLLWAGGTLGPKYGVADFPVAIPYDKFRGAWVHAGFAPTDDGHPAAPGRPTWSAQMRDGFTTIELTGGTPGLPVSLEVSWAD